MIDEEDNQTMNDTKAIDIVERLKVGKDTFQYNEIQALLKDILTEEINDFRNKIREILYGFDSKIGVRAVIDYVIERYRITFDELQGKSRKRHIVEARQICHWMVRNRICYNQLSLSAIGEVIGGRDHATVLHSTRNINNLVAVDRIFRERLMIMCNELGARVAWMPVEKELLITGYMKSPKDEIVSTEKEGQAEHA